MAYLAVFSRKMQGKAPQTLKSGKSSLPPFVEGREISKGRESGFTKFGGGGGPKLVVSETWELSCF